MWGLQCYWEWREMEEHTHKSYPHTWQRQEHIIKKTKKDHLVRWKRNNGQWSINLNQLKKKAIFNNIQLHFLKHRVINAPRVSSDERNGSRTTRPMQYSQLTFDNCGGINAINSLHIHVTGKNHLSNDVIMLDKFVDGKISFTVSNHLLHVAYFW